MTLSFTLVCLWVVLAGVITLFPSRRHHWPAAYGLIAIGLPLLAFVTWENGPWAGLVALAVGLLVLRWPALAFLRWLMRRLR